VTRWWLAAVAVVTLIAVALSGPGDLTDLEVYQAGGASWLHGSPLYTDEFPFWLPFTYPPVAAVLFGALAILPLMAAATLLTAAGLVGLSLASFGAVPHRVVALLAATCGVLLEPVRTTLTFGQVNLVLMGLVAADCLLGRTRWPRGMLVGLAAAVKLTPMVFVVFFLARRQPGAAVTATVTFAAATSAGMLLAPSDSLRYWHTTIFDPSRIGGGEFVTNQSLRGALTRLGLPEVCWVVLVLVVLALAWRGARRAAEPVMALLVVAAAGLLVSPVSWSHHWVWIVPAVFVFAVRLYRNRRGMVALAAVVVAFAVGHRFLPHARQRELEWTWWQHVLGNSYVLVAMAFLFWCATTRLARTPAPVREVAAA
jgi:alpha-1,2-mannosyltransferase